MLQVQAEVAELKKELEEARDGEKERIEMAVQAAVCIIPNSLPFFLVVCTVLTLICSIYMHCSYVYLFFTCCSYICLYMKFLCLPVHDMLFLHLLLYEVLMSACSLRAVLTSIFI